jgi:hypothetical protein
MTIRLPPKGLFPDATWFYHRLKIYAWVAVGSACAVLFVAGWMAERTASDSLLTRILSAIALLASVASVLAVRSGHLLSRNGKYPHHPLP